MVAGTTSSSSRAAEGESVIVVIDANRSKVSVDAVCWALKYVVRPKDTVVVLGILYELGRKTSCLPFHIGIGNAGIWERLELSGGEVNPEELEELEVEIKKKREQYQSSLQPFYRQCRKSEVKLEVKLTAGIDAKEITIEEARNSNTRWIVLDSHLKKEKVFINGHVDCNIAVMKAKDGATLIARKASDTLQIPRRGTRVDTEHIITPCQAQIDDDQDLTGVRPAAAPPGTPLWYPLAWRTGFPRSFTLAELRDMTNGFGEENHVLEQDDIKLYNGTLQETPVLVQRYPGNDHPLFWSLLKILSRVRHRNIMNLVGYCCTGSSMFLIFDYPIMGTLEVNLRREDKAEHLSWRLRWYIAQEIGATLRYLHEECADGPIVHLSLCSSTIIFSHGCSAMLCNFTTAKMLKDDTRSAEASSSQQSRKAEQDEYLSADVRHYGVFLLELIAGKSAGDFRAQSSGQSLIDWALPLLENGSVGEVMDPRVRDSDDSMMLNRMARAAVFCLKNNSGRRLSISEVLAVVRGDKGWVSEYPYC